MKLPVDVRDIMNASSRVAEERERSIRIAVFVDVEAPNALVDAIQAALRPHTAGARLHVEAVGPGETLVVDESADAVVAVCGPGDTLGRSLASARDKLVPAVALALEEDADAVSTRLGHPLTDTVSDADAVQVADGLATWLADRIHQKRLALAANFAFMRRAVAVEYVKSTAFQNAVVGAVFIIPGADLPIMTANQAKMVLQIAAAYGVPLGTDRIKELAAVVGGAFAFRAVARQALNFVPGIGWAIKGAIGYSGTLAMGYAAIEYFESGGDVSGLAERIKDARDKAVEGASAARGRLRKGGRPVEVIPADAYVIDRSATALGAPADELTNAQAPEGEQAE